MNRVEAISALSEAGIIGDDAQTSLDAALKGRTVDAVLSTVPKDNVEVMRLFGQDGGRAMIVLREAARALREPF